MHGLSSLNQAMDDKSESDKNYYRLFVITVLSTFPEVPLRFLIILYCLNLNLCPGMGRGRLLWAFHTSVQ